MSASDQWAFGLARWSATLGRDLQRAARALGAPQALWSADRATLRALLRLDAGAVNELIRLRDAGDLMEMRARYEAAGIDHVDSSDGRWPPKLTGLVDEPFGLFVRGGQPSTWDALRDAPTVALVGSRRATARGKAFARSLAAELASAGAVIVSGLAYGIDTAVHEGALSADGVTVAVLGCGVDVPYPRRNRHLAEQITRRGLLMSEYCPGTKPTPWHFPARNRIVAGLVDAVGVIEAGERSGALITADFALELGRPVMATPGWPTDGNSRGCNALLRAGAGLLESSVDLRDEIPHGVWRPMSGGSVAQHEGIAARVISTLAREPLTAEALGIHLDASAARLAGTLALLEVDGVIARDDGQRYVVVRPDRSDAGDRDAAPPTAAPATPG